LTFGWAAISLSLLHMCFGGLANLLEQQHSCSQQKFDSDTVDMVSLLQINNAGMNKGFRPLVEFSDEEISQVRNLQSLFTMMAFLMWDWVWQISSNLCLVIKCNHFFNRFLKWAELRWTRWSNWLMEVWQPVLCIDCLPADCIHKPDRLFNLHPWSYSCYEQATERRPYIQHGWCWFWRHKYSSDCCVSFFFTVRRWRLLMICPNSRQPFAVAFTACIPFQVGSVFCKQPYTCTHVFVSLIRESHLWLIGGLR
jgi:hypothetical protein